MIVTCNKIPRPLIPFLQGLGDSRLAWLKCYELFILIGSLFLLHCGEWQCRQVGITGNSSIYRHCIHAPFLPAVLERTLQKEVSPPAPAVCSTVTAHWPISASVLIGSPRAWPRLSVTGREGMSKRRWWVRHKLSWEHSGADAPVTSRAVFTMEEMRVHRGRLMTVTLLGPHSP